MGLQEAIIEKLGKEAIAKIKPKECLELLLAKLKESAALLDDEAKDEILSSIAVIAHEVGDIVHALETAHAKKK